MKRIILSSTSPVRKSLLQRLQIPFETTAPNIDETPLPGELPTALVARLAEAKARAVTEQFADSLIIGSDEVGDLNGNIIGKPGSHENAVQQLFALSGQRVNFVTGLCLYNTQTQQTQVCVEPFEVVFRQLSRNDIEAYLKQDQPYQCAGSLKAEGLGIVLLQELRGADPAALLGLPLIRLVDMLKQEGIHPLFYNDHFIPSPLNPSFCDPTVAPER